MKKIISLMIAVLLAVSCLSVNVFAIEFDGSVKTQEELNKAWLEAFEDFLKDPVNKADDMIEANYAFTVGFGENYGTGFINGIMDTSDFLDSVVTDVVNNGKISDDSLSKFRDIFTATGFQLDNESFEKWYNDKFGKGYSKSFGDVKFGEIQEMKKEYPYWYKYQDSLSSGIVFFKSPEVLFNVNEINGHKCVGIWQATEGIQVYRWKPSYNPNDQGFHKQQYVPRGDYCLDVDDNLYITDTNMPLNSWGGIFDESGLDDFFSDVTEGGDGLTSDELGDLTDDLLQALLDNMPDLSTVEGILQAIYRKCCEISNKIGKTTTNVYNQSLQGIQACLDKIASFCGGFWTDFSKSMHTLFIPEENYAADKYDSLIATFKNKFGFASEIRNEIDGFITLLDKPPASTFSIHYKSIKLDLSVFDSHIDLIRYCVAIPIYFVFIVRIYRKTPWYMQGGGE